MNSKYNRFFTYFMFAILIVIFVAILLTMIKSGMLPLPKIGINASWTPNLVAGHGAKVMALAIPNLYDPTGAQIALFAAAALLLCLGVFFIIQDARRKLPTQLEWTGIGIAFILVAILFTAIANSLPLIINQFGLGTMVGGTKVLALAAPTKHVFDPSMFVMVASLGTIVALLGLALSQFKNVRTSQAGLVIEICGLIIMVLAAVGLLKPDFYDSLFGGLGQVPAVGFAATIAIPISRSKKLSNKWLFILILVIVVAIAAFFGATTLPRHANASLPDVSTTNGVLVMTATAANNGCHYQLNIGETMWRQIDDPNPCNPNRRLAWFQEIKSQLLEFLNKFGDGQSTVQEMNVSLMTAVPK